jgi:hypothetical protein
LRLCQTKENQKPLFSPTKSWFHRIHISDYQLHYFILL